MAPDVTTQAEKSSWRISRDIPVALLWVIAGQFFVIAGFALKIVFTVEDHEKRLSAGEASRAEQRLTLLESQMADVRGSLLRMEGKLDQALMGGARR